MVLKNEEATIERERARERKDVHITQYAQERTFSLPVEQTHKTFILFVLDSPRIFLRFEYKGKISTKSVNTYMYRIDNVGSEQYTPEAVGEVLLAQCAMCGGVGDPSSGPPPPPCCPPLMLLQYDIIVSPAIKPTLYNCIDTLRSNAEHKPDLGRGYSLSA